CQDIRYAIRGFRRAPLFALSVIVTIALGLGLNTAIFTIFSAYVLRPFDVRDPHALFEVFQTTRTNNSFNFSPAEFDDLRKQKIVFTHVVGGRFIQTRVEGRQAFGEFVSRDYFRILGVGTVLGRPLDPDDTAEAVVVLSYTMWQTTFGGDSEIIG